jgi:hypothetical protein
MIQQWDLLFEEWGGWHGWQIRDVYISILFDLVDHQGREFRRRVG